MSVDNEAQADGESNAQRRLVVFDTNVIEGRYLAPLLRGQRCRDLDLLRAHTPAYTPALYVKSFYEICQHAKLGGKSFPWCAPDCGYPGGLDKGRAILKDHPDFGNEANVYWWFNMAEEWRGCDWEQKASLCRSFVRADAVDSALHDLSLRQTFAEWKFAVSAFCDRVWDVLTREMVILTPHDVYGLKGERLNEVFSLEMDLARNALVPNEDFEIVSAALICGAEAFVTCEKQILSRTAITLNLNGKIAFVHVDQIAEALAEDFTFRWTSEQAAPRVRG
jgi:hypothetical protein